MYRKKKETKNKKSELRQKNEGKMKFLLVCLFSFFLLGSAVAARYSEITSSSLIFQMRHQHHGSCVVRH